MDRRRDLTGTSYVLLGLLSLRSWSAYELAEQMARGMRYLWPRAERGVYYEPKNLVAHGLATVRVRSEGGRRRSVYSITAKGRRSLAAWLATRPVAPELHESEALVRVGFSEHGTKADAQAALARMRMQSDEMLFDLEGRAREYLTTGGPFPDRLHLIALWARYLLEHAEILERFAAWATDEIQGWPDTTHPEAFASRGDVFREILDAAERRRARRSGSSVAVDPG